MGSYAYTPLMYSFMDLALLQRDHLRANNWCILINKDRRRRNHHLQGDPSWWTSSFPLVSSVHQDLEIQDLYLTYQNHTTGYHRIPSRHYHQYLYLLCLHWKSHRPKKISKVFKTEIKYKDLNNDHLPLANLNFKPLTNEISPRIFIFVPTISSLILHYCLKFRIQRSPHCDLNRWDPFEICFTFAKIS